MINRKQRVAGCLVGLAIGDAVGTTLEFREPGSFAPISDMVGGGPFNLEAGQWTDDTSMALCLAYSLMETKRFDPLDQMQRYCRWRKEGYMSSTGRCFDIGVTVSEAISQFLRTGNPYSGPTSPFSAGNGSLMRLAPVVIAFSLNREKTTFYAGESSRTTHGAKECVDACRYFSNLLLCAFDGLEKSQILANSVYFPETKKIRAICQGEYLQKNISQIKGTGYVVESLEAALWCFANTNSFEDAILTAANLGNDADTTAAICGQIAGAYYGLEAIPAGWKSKTYMLQKIIDVANNLHKMAFNDCQKAP